MQPAMPCSCFHCPHTKCLQLGEKGSNSALFETREVAKGGKPLGIEPGKKQRHPSQGQKDLPKTAQCIDFDRRFLATSVTFASFALRATQNCAACLQTPNRRNVMDKLRGQVSYDIKLWSATAAPQDPQPTFEDSTRNSKKWASEHSLESPGSYIQESWARRLCVVG